MAKRRVDNHLKEDASETLVSSLLPEEWVIRSKRNVALTEFPSRARGLRLADFTLS